MLLLALAVVVSQSSCGLLVRIPALDRHPWEVARIQDNQLQAFKEGTESKL